MADITQNTSEAVQLPVIDPEWLVCRNSICKAAEAGDAKLLEVLVYQRYPDFVPHVNEHIAALQGGPAVYEVFLAKWPYLLDIDIGHNGNPIGWSVFGNVTVMVDFLLSKKGVDPNTAHFSGRVVSHLNEMNVIVLVSETI